LSATHAEQLFVHLSGNSIAYIEWVMSMFIVSDVQPSVAVCCLSSRWHQSGVCVCCVCSSFRSHFCSVFFRSRDAQRPLQSAMHAPGAQFPAMSDSSAGAAGAGCGAVVRPPRFYTAQDQEASERLHDVESGLRLAFATLSELRDANAQTAITLQGLTTQMASLQTWCGWWTRLHQWMLRCARDFPWH
jgi:hypothetical protein